jgi:hypothetical protein
MSIKEEAIRAISSLPDNSQIDDVMYRLYVIDKVTRGQTAYRRIESLELSGCGLKEVGK